MRYRLGLDLGIASVGWSIMECDENGEPFRIENMGVRCFDKAEQPKTGASLAEPRRDARGLRRRIRRKAHRIERAKFEIKKEFGITEFKNNLDIYKLRSLALDEKITSSQLSVVLLYLIKHRGFHSSRKLESKDKEAGKLLSNTTANREYRIDKGYRTVGEMMCKDTRYHSYITKEGGTKIKVYNTRNKGGEYKNCILRAELLEEMQIIFKNQKSLGANISVEFQEKIIDIFSSQRTFDEGPGYPSPYKSGFAVGNCEHEKEEKRASKGTYTFEFFTSLQKLTNLKIKTKTTSRELTKEEFEILVDYIKKSKSITYTQIRKKIGLKEEEYFNLLTYSYKKSIAEIEKVKAFAMERSYAIKKCLLEENQNDFELIDAVAEVLSMNKTDERIYNEMAQNQITQKLQTKEIDNLIEINFTKFGNLSLKAMRNMLPYMLEGKKYTESLTLAGYQLSANIATEKRRTLKGKDIVDSINEITSPTVKRAVSQTIKVINAIINQYGSPMFVNIELAREVGKSFSERMQIDKSMKENQTNNERILNKIKSEFGIPFPKGLDIVKYKLYEEQGCKCAYSQKEIPIDKLFDPTYLQVDHVIPYSRCFDDSYSNKVLVLSSENQDKGNRTPYEWFGKTSRWKQYVDFVEVYYARNFKKREKLLKQVFAEDEERSWKERSLQDTKYISRFMHGLISKNLQFVESEKKKRVYSVNGAITSQLRKIWGVLKVREDGDLHHAVDAVVIACATDGMTQKLTKWSKNKELYYHDGKNMYVNKITGELQTQEKSLKEIKIKFEPYPNFLKELELRLFENPQNYYDEFAKIGYEVEEFERVKPIFISRTSSKKVKGQMHDQTIRSGKYIDNGNMYMDAGYVVSKTAITNLKLDKNGEIENYFNKEDDKLLYEAIKNRLEEYNGKAEEAFKEPFYKPKRNGENGNQVKAVKVYKKASGVSIDKTKGFADNSSMIRVDIFQKDGKYYGVPVYIADYYKGVLPNRAVTRGKSMSDWDEMTPEYEFLFSLSKNDLFYIESNKEVDLAANNGSGRKITIKNGLLYFNSFGIATASINCNNHDNSFSKPSLGIKTLSKLEKYQVDALGNHSKVGKEKRKCFK
ncbi:MAG: type II CRISPR RNA-guided endonuclease Cas9 [Bacillota bacterium]